MYPTIHRFNTMWPPRPRVVSWFKNQSDCSYTMLYINHQKPCIKSSRGPLPTGLESLELAQVEHGNTARSCDELWCDE